MSDQAAPDPPDDPRLAGVRARLDGVRATLSLAQALAESGQLIDLAGLDEQVGPACAAALDLPVPLAQTLRLELAMLGAQVGDLLATLRARLPDGG